MTISEQRDGSRTTHPRAPRGRRAGLVMAVVFAAAEVVFLTSSFLVVVPYALQGASTADQNLPPGALLLSVLVPTVLAALTALAGTAAFGGGRRAGRVRRELAIRWNWRHAGLGLAIGVGGLAITLPAASVWSAMVGEDDASSAVGEAFAGRNLGPAVALGAFLAIGLVAPLCEELIFRGTLWRALEHFRLNPWIIFVLTTAIFAMAHMELLRSPLLLVISIPVGLGRLFTGNVLTSIVTHQINNLLPAASLLSTTLG
ncbi:CPBP family intramembrane glutamic endopeptidase [Haloechinothrix aidingensis]|nr:CPBP family intramembrane glutamic endopeptidase [Haloechinothrix aidingensis]